MKMTFALATLVAAAMLAGCAGTPQSPVMLAPSTIAAKSSRIGVSMTAMPKVDTHIMGAGCLLCYAAAAMMNSSLTAHITTLPPEGLSQLKQEVFDAIAKKGATPVLIAEAIKIEDLPKFSGQQPNVALQDYSSFRQKYQIDKLLVINVTEVGAERSYSGYIPTSDPKGVLRGVGYMVDLTKNAYEWYLPVDVLKSAAGNWDEPPKFPGVTNAYFQALETGKDAFLAPFK